jgi:hypothetical protein
MRGPAVSILCMLAFSAWSSFADTVPRPRRVALVIGNGKYPGHETPYPLNDAKAIKEKLESLTFDAIVYKCDLTHDQMIAAIDEFGQKLADADQAFVYYAGHGAQIAVPGTAFAENYLVPVDATAVDPAHIATTTVNVSTIFDKLRAGHSKFNLVILDACRNNPLLVSVPDPSKVCNGWDCGLGRPKSPPAGTIVAYPTDAGSLADDVGADGEHSPYANALLHNMGEPGLPINEFFMRVRAAVEVAARQNSWESTSQKTPFMFRDPAYVAVTIRDADDEATVLLNGQSVQKSIDGGRTRMLRLQPGDNVLRLSVFNQASKHNVFFVAEVWEGWNYDVRIEGGTKPPAPLMGHEDCPDPTLQQVQEGIQHPVFDSRGNARFPAWQCFPKSHFGRSFWAAAVRINVNRETGEVTYPVTENHIWVDGFSLADGSVRDELDLSAAWAVARRGIRLYDNAIPGARVPIAALRAAIEAAHKASGIAADSHARALELLAAASDEELAAAVDRARDWELRDRGGLVEDVRWALRNGGPALNTAAGAGNFTELRKQFFDLQNENEDLRNELALVSNGELLAIINAAH